MAKAVKVNPWLKNKLNLFFIKIFKSIFRHSIKLGNAKNLTSLIKMRRKIFSSIFKFFLNIWNFFRFPFVLGWILEFFKCEIRFWCLLLKTVLFNGKSSWFSHELILCIELIETVNLYWTFSLNQSFKDMKNQTGRSTPKPPNICKY